MNLQYTLYCTRYSLQVNIRNSAVHNLLYKVQGTVNLQQLHSPLHLARREEQSRTDESVRCRVASRASRVLPSFLNTVRYLAGCRVQLQLQGEKQQHLVCPLPLDLEARPISMASLWT